MESLLLPDDLEWRGYANAGLFKDTAARIAQLAPSLQAVPFPGDPPEDYIKDLYTLGGLYWARHDYPPGLACFQRAAGLAENQFPARFLAWCLNAIGDTHAEMGSYDAAISAYRRALELDPASAYACVGLGGLFGDLLDRPVEAETLYRQALSIGGLSAHLVAIVYNGLGNVYYLQERFADAAAEYGLAIAADPGFLSPYDNLGALAMKMGDFAEAQRCFAERIRLRPQHSLGAYVSLGIIARCLGDPAAQGWFHRALEAVEPASEAHYETPAGILEKKALALFGLDRAFEALAVIDGLLAARAPGEVIELFRFELLQAAPNPPDGLNRAIAALRGSPRTDSVSQYRP